MTWLLSIECLNTANAAETLYFSDDSYVSDTFEVYPNRLTQPSNLTISPNDGGVLSIFKESSVGDIELDNTDRELDFLFPNNVDSSKTYKLDGRNAILKLNGTEYLRATIDSVSQRDGKIVLSLKSLSESLVNPIDLDEYTGNSNLEGDSDLIGTAKPIVYGYCKNITPFRTGGASDEIYQASDSDDAIVTAVYSNGARDANYLAYDDTPNLNVIGATSIRIYSGSGGIPNGSWLAIEGDNGEMNFYQTTAELADNADDLPATVPINTPLINNITGGIDGAGTPIEVVNSYATTVAMVADISPVNAAYSWKSINGYFRRTINEMGKVITCDVATRPTGDSVTAGLFVVNDYYRIEVIGTTDFTLIGATANTVGLIFKATGVGTGTGTAQEISPFVTDKAFDVFEKIVKDDGIVNANSLVAGNSYKIHFIGSTTNWVAIGASATPTVGEIFTATGVAGNGNGNARGIGSFTVNQALKTTINNYGDLGVYYDTEKPKKDLLDDVIRSIGACYWFVGSEVQIYLLDEPKATEDFIIEEYKILEITRENTGIGENGVPYQGYKIGFDKIETVQAGNLAGIVELSPARKSYLAKEYRYIKSINGTTKSKRLLSKICEFNSLLRNRTQLSGIITGRLRPLTTQRRDVVSFSVKLNELPVFSIGDTILLKHRDFDYSAGRLMIIVGYEVDAQAMSVKFLVCG